MPAQESFERAAENPILSPADLPFRAVAVLNPGAAPNVVFPTGALVRGDELWTYYGAPDRCIGLATAKIDHLLAVLEG